ncbi:uncharacterized protein DUF4292 [Dyadobacter jejuensis]|uniref:Uncharacterized protein DUF4292 n=1 Tax=Dyadobacter jejuensis TaxID=1082580 RepID=A0A316A7Y8_9BACT|nr:DUF4292 domain-containing protein [Dyadobacter jejuensis]PWJ53733.1 uncharacterized protein DUF4292 [Dyadobacter jejuensis]
MNNRIGIWWLLVVVLAVSACHRPRHTKSQKDSMVLRDSAQSTADSANLNMERLKLDTFDFQYLTTKSKFSFKNRKQDLDNVTVNMRVSKDSLIWLSVSGVGLEVARGLISRDSIVFLDKIHKEYFNVTYAELSEKYQFQLSYGLLQSVIVGDLPFPVDSAVSVSRQEGQYVFSQVIDRIVSQNFVGIENRKLLGMKAVENASNNTFTIQYKDFEKVDGMLFPFESSLNLDVRSPQDQQNYQTQVGLRHNKVEVTNESPGFPFSIPSSYKRKR